MIHRVKGLTLSALAIGAGSLLTATGASAQGSLSTQGFGYPVGQISTRAAGTAGALADFDSRSPQNPAALLFSERGDVFAQYDPELRNVKGPAGSSRSTTSRFSNIGIVLPLGEKFSIGFHGSTFLDRTWATNAVRQQTIGTDVVTSTETVKSEGGITDLRYGIAYQLLPGIKVGLAGHTYTGRNNVNLLQEFPDSFAYGNVSQTTLLNYSGTAFSGGIIIDAIPTLGLAISGKKGGKIKMSARDTLLTTGNIPDRYSASLSYSGIPGTVIAARYVNDRWSSMTALSTVGDTAVDATEFSAGLETNATRIGAGGTPILLRIGARWRTLPFMAGGEEVKEMSFGGGAGIPLANNRVGLDLALLRSNRKGISGIKEGAFNISLGLRITP